MSADLELRRLVERWQQLPLDQALSRMPVVRPVVQALADAVADTEQRPHVAVPDLGPRVVMDQLTVVAYDATRAGLDVSGQLADLRRALVDRSAPHLDQPGGAPGEQDHPADDQR